MRVRVHMWVSVYCVIYSLDQASVQVLVLCWLLKCFLKYAYPFECLCESVGHMTASTVPSSSSSGSTVMVGEPWDNQLWFALGVPSAKELEHIMILNDLCNDSVYWSRICALTSRLCLLCLHPCLLYACTCCLGLGFKLPCAFLGRFFWNVFWLSFTPSCISLLFYVPSVALTRHTTANALAAMSLARKRLCFTTFTWLICLLH